MAHSFYAYLTPHIVVGVLLLCQSLDPEYKMTAFFQMHFPKKTLSYIRVNAGKYIFSPFFSFEGRGTVLLFDLWF